MSAILNKPYLILKIWLPEPRFFTVGSYVNCKIQSRLFLEFYIFWITKLSLQRNDM